MTRQTEILIIGAGPAGLSAAQACIVHGREFLVIETGSRVAHRDHKHHRELGAGVGGSGLFSDGKFSFYPSASALWAMPDAGALEESWCWFSDAVARFGLTTPPLSTQPRDHAPDPGTQFGADVVPRKNYESIYMELDDRRRLIAQLEAACGTHLLPGVELRSVNYDQERQLFRCVVRGSEAPYLNEIEARAVVYAGGRFGSIGWTTIFPQIPQRFRRVEMGVRLEQRSGEFFLEHDTHLDTKLILKSSDGRYSWRTFCCCRNGEVVKTEVRGVLSFSGRADGARTGESNVGFNLRVMDPDLADSLWPNGPVFTDGKRRIADQPLHEFLLNPTIGGIADVVGAEAACLVAEGLHLLCSAYPRLRDFPCRVVAPVIEGVGLYPQLTDTLRSGEFPLWVAGDATGVFRGLTAAMVSGYFAALQAAGFLEASEMDLTKQLPIVFTAQSKQYFYCRDAICVFVLKNMRVPLNPFKAFDYFLSDRVERDRVRQANFNLIRVADELWVFGDTIANGVLAEIRYAIAQKKPIRFFTISADPEEIRPLNLEEIDQLKSESELSEGMGAETFRAYIGSVQQWLRSTSGTK